MKLHGTQWFSIALILVGGTYLIRLARHSEPDMWVYQPAIADGPAGPDVAAGIPAESSEIAGGIESPPDAEPEPQPDPADEAEPPDPPAPGTPAV